MFMGFEDNTYIVGQVPVPLSFNSVVGYFLEAKISPAKDKIVAPDQVSKSLRLES